MEATLFLADAAQVSPDGKLHALGIGWQFVGAPTSPSAVVFLLHVPWDETNRKIKWELDLLDADGRPVLLPSAVPNQFQRIHMEQSIEVGRPAGIKPGTPINVPAAITVGPLQLQPNSTYEWVLKVGEQTWKIGFATRDGAPPT